jgi:hypothetical protein
MYAPNYQRDYYLYLAAADTTIAMVLVQEENGLNILILFEVKSSMIQKVNILTLKS